LEDFEPAAQVLGQKSPGLFGEIEEDRARFKDGYRGAAVTRLVIDNCRNAIVGRDCEEFRLKLIAAIEINRMDKTDTLGMAAPIPKKNTSLTQSN
jgi:hypothetical protein